MRGDALASGAKSATFSVAPGLKFDEGQMHDDLCKLPSEEFILKYMITQREYDILYAGRDNEERVSSFAQQIQMAQRSVEEQYAEEAKQEATLRRDCFLTPFVALDLTGRVIVDRDQPAKPESKLAIPKRLRKERTLLPTTGHIIKAEVFSSTGANVSGEFVGRRVLFGQMSGTPIMFKGFPTWIQLELAEILAWVNKEDIEVLEEEPEPMV